MIAEMKRRLERLERLERLKARMVRHSARWPLMVWNMRPLPKERIENLAVNERVVNDWYRDIRGIVWMRERITAEPNDHGRKCEPDGYLADVLEEVHRDCEHRTEGACRACAGTPLTGRPPELAGSTADPPP